MDAKREVLKSYVRIEELPLGSCFLTWNKNESDHSNVENIELKYMGDAGQKFGTTIGLQVDKLLGSWIKIKQCINYPANQRILAFLALQPLWMNNYFEVWIHERYRQYRIFEPQPFYWFDGEPYLSARQTLLNLGNNQLVYIDPKFPFVFVEFMTSGEETNIMTTDDFMIERLSTKRKVHFLPTSNPRVYLLILSDVLETEKDCKKIMRKYLKTPNHPVWEKYEFMHHPLVRLSSLSEYGLRFTILHYNYDGLTCDRYDLDSAVVKLAEKVSTRIQDDLVLQSYFNTSSPAVARSSIYRELEYNDQESHCAEDLTLDEIQTLRADFYNN